MKSIEVQCSQENAFTVFMDMGSWWPTNKFATSVMRGQSVKTLRVDVREGGRIVEVGSDGKEVVWGTIKKYEPYSYLNMDFHVPHPSESNPGFSTVEVRFTALGSDRTRVELTQSNWEALGDVAKMVQGGYRQAWVMIFDGAYKARAETEQNAQT
ncbi:MAG: SRPBCC domain-containing protein [Gemmatimonadaceae bacterium]